MPRGRTSWMPPYELVKETPAPVVQTVNDRGRQRRSSQRQTRQAVQDICGRATDQRASGRRDTPNVELQPPVACDQQREAGQSVRTPAEGRVELRRGIEAGLIRLDDPKQAV